MKLKRTTPPLWLIILAHIVVAAGCDGAVAPPDGGDEDTDAGAPIDASPLDAARADASTEPDAAMEPDGGSSTPDAGPATDDAGPDLDGGPPPVEVAPLYAAFADWNDYLTNDGSTFDAASGAPCDASADHDGYASCLHGGELRVVDVPALADCDGVTASDALGAFEWTCLDGPGGVRVASLGLKRDVPMATLLDFTAGAFLPNSVTVERGGTPVLTTASTVWWSNPVQRLTSSHVLNTPGTVYVVGASLTADFEITADRVALVVAPGAVVTGDPSVDTRDAEVVLISTHASDAVDFAWLEGELHGDPTSSETSAVFLYHTNFAVVRHVTVSGMPQLASSPSSAQWGLSLLSSDHARIEHVRSFGCRTAVGIAQSTAVRVSDLRASLGVTGVHLYNAPQTTLEDVSLFGMENTGIFASSTGRLRFARVYAASGRDGVVLRQIKSAALLGVTVVNNSRDGLSLESGTVASTRVPTEDVTMVGLLALNNGGDGLRLDSADRTRVHHAFSLVNGGAGIELASDSSGPSESNLFAGALGVGGNGGGDCVVSTGSEGLGDAGGGPTSCQITGASTATLSVIDLDALSQDPILGEMTRNDSTNTSDINGARDFAAITDWLGFFDPSSGWGLDGGTFPSADQRGPCLSGTCRIWSLAIRVASDNPLRDVASVPNGDDRFTTRETGSTSTTALLYAAELTGDRVGDDDGLCESGERCLFHPNAGGYQGHGPLRDVPFVDGAITGVELRERLTNGYIPLPVFPLP